MMTNYLLPIMVAVCLINCQPKQVATDTENLANQIVIGQIDSVYSDILNESRNIWVHLPESAKLATSVETKYPVLYLLDGPGHFYSVTGMIKQLSTSNGNTQVPEMIVVAIPNTDRNRDLTPTLVNFDPVFKDSIDYASGGGSQFLDFIEEELIPHVEKKYPAASYRTFVGHSFGGLSVINALISKPQLFNNYIAIDPSLWWDNQAFLRTADSVLTEDNFSGKSLYVGVANTMEKGNDLDQVPNDTSSSTFHIRSILKFVNALDTKSDNGLIFDWKYYSDDDHSSVPLITEYDALRSMFSWYNFSEADQFFDPASTATAEEVINVIKSHYEDVSSRFGYTVLPPEQFINSLGYGFLNSDMLDKAAAVFDLNIQNYPNSTNVYDSRGDSYLAQQDSAKALEYFNKALEVGDNDFSQEKIDMLKEEMKN